MTDMSDENTMIPPVNPGEVLERQEVINSGKKNDGVIKYEGYIIFINDCKEGDIIDLKMDRVLPKFGIGTLMKIHKEGDEE